MVKSKAAALALIDRGAEGEFAAVYRRGRPRGD